MGRWGKFKINEDNPNFIFENFYKGSPWGGFSLDEKEAKLAKIRLSCISIIKKLCYIVISII